MTANIFLLPGFDGTGELYAPLQSALGEDYPTVAIRYRDEVTFDDYVNLVSSMLPPKDAILIAESFSGPIALELIKRHPSQIKCVVLCATFASSPFYFLTRLSSFLPDFFFRLNPAQKAILQGFCFDRKTDPALISKALSVIRSVPARVIKSRIRVLAGIDIYASLSQIAVPVLYIQAMQDKIVGAQLSQKLVGGMPNVTVKKVDGPHLLLQTRPDECAAIIKSFITVGVRDVK